MSEPIIRKRKLKKNDFDLIWAYSLIHPEKTQGEIGQDCGGWDGNTVSRVMKCGGDYEKFEELKAEHNKKYKAKNKETRNIAETNNNQSPTMIVSFDQMKALAKDIDQIKKSLDLLCAICGELLNQWKVG